MCLELIFFLDKIRQKILPSNIIVPLPKKSLSPSEKVKKASGNLDDIEAPVVTIRRKDLYDKK